MFSIGPPRDYTNSPVVNQRQTGRLTVGPNITLTLTLTLKSVVEREREWGESLAVKEDGL
jgi:hypothetical protein